MIPLILGYYPNPDKNITYQCNNMIVNNYYKEYDFINLFHEVENTNTEENDNKIYETKEYNCIIYMSGLIDLKIIQILKGKFIKFNVPKIALNVTVNDDAIDEMNIFDHIITRNITDATNHHWDYLPDQVFNLPQYLIYGNLINNKNNIKLKIAIFLIKIEQGELLNMFNTLNKLIEDHEITIFTYHIDNLEQICKLKHSSITIISSINNIEGLLFDLGPYNYAICMRYYSMIICTMLKIPFISITTDKKTKLYIQEHNLSEYDSPSYNFLDYFDMLKDDNLNEKLEQIYEKNRALLQINMIEKIKLIVENVYKKRIKEIDIEGENINVKKVERIEQIEKQTSKEGIKDEGIKDEKIKNEEINLENTDVNIDTEGKEIEKTEELNLQDEQIDLPENQNTQIIELTKEKDIEKKNQKEQLDESSLIILKTPFTDLTLEIGNIEGIRKFIGFNHPYLDLFYNNGINVYYINKKTKVKFKRQWIGVIDPNFDNYINYNYTNCIGIISNNSDIRNLLHNSFYLRNMNIHTLLLKYDKDFITNLCKCKFYKMK
jgi:hypothetical protein